MERTEIVRYGRPMPVLDPTEVTVIVPYYNSRKHALRMLDSVRNQSHRSFMCILVDDGSTDGSFDYIDECIKGDLRFVNLKRIDSFKPGGRGAKNFGYSLCDSTFVVFFDSDDVMYPDFLESRCEYLRQNIDKDAVISDYGWKVRMGEPKRIFRYNRKIFSDFVRNTREEGFWLHYIDYRFFFPPGNAMWRKKSIDDRPGWDENTSIGEDFEYHARMMLSGLDIGIIEGVHWDYMANEESMIATSESIGPLLGRSYARMLVMDHIVETLGDRPRLIRKELAWEIRIIRRIISCESTKQEKSAAVGIMYDRLDKLMNMLHYDVGKKKAIRYWLDLIVKWDMRTSKAHRLYEFLMRDITPTSELEYFNIS